MEVPTKALEIINESRLSSSDKNLVTTIIHNMHVRGLLYSETDVIIATTECVVLANCLRNNTKAESKDLDLLTTTPQTLHEEQKP